MTVARVYDVNDVNIPLFLLATCRHGVSNGSVAFSAPLFLLITKAVTAHTTIALVFLSIYSVNAFIDI